MTSPSLMFAFVRHAEYAIGSGSLTERGRVGAQQLAELLSDPVVAWTAVRFSPAPRCLETGTIIARALSIPFTEDPRLAMDGNFVDLLPPTEPHGLIFVSHLPVLAQMLHAWAKRFHQPEPPLTQEATGYVIDPAAGLMTAVAPSPLLDHP